MKANSLSETLLQMAETHSSRSETDRLRDVFADIEAALEKGVSRKAVLDALHQEGFTMSLKMFDKALYRIRKSKKTTLSTTSKDSYTTPVSKEVKPETSINRPSEKQLTLRQQMKLDREEIENTDWAKLIREREIEKQSAKKNRKD